MTAQCENKGPGISNGAGKIQQINSQKTILPRTDQKLHECSNCKLDVDEAEIKQRELGF